MDLNYLLEQVKKAIFNDPTTPQQPGHDPSGLISQIEGLFGQQRQERSPGQVLPASQDPYGDPADQPRGNYAYMSGGETSPYGNVRPASEDPLGDPADQEQNRRFRNLKPASEDPLGDPADQ